MPLITLDIPQHKMPLVKEFMKGNGLKEEHSRNFSDSPSYSSPDNARHYLPTAYTMPSKGWEDFKNELEYE